MSWLSQTRKALRAKEINLYGKFQPSEKEETAIRELIASSSPLVADLLEGVEIAKAVKLENAFQNGLEKGVLRTIKGVRLGISRGYVDQVDVTKAENLETIAGEYRAAVDFVLSLSNLGTSTFKKAATITPFWNGEELSDKTRVENIVTYLEKKGVEMTEEEVEELFTRRVRMHFAVHNISDPLKAIGRAAVHVKETLTSAKIRAHLKGKGVEMTEEEVEEVFTRGVRMYFAVRNISDPLEACYRYAKGELAVRGYYVDGLK